MAYFCGMAVFFLFALFVLQLYTLLLGYYQKGFRQLKFYSATSFSGKTKVTILIPARNEAANIENCLTAIHLQTYPKELLQVIVIDDFSTDATSLLVKKFSSEHNPAGHLNTAGPFTLLSLKDFIAEGSTNSYKKKGIEIAMTHTTGELIVCTDADCVAGENWISNLVSFYEKTNAQFIAAPVTLSPNPETKELAHGKKIKWRFVEIFQTLDFIILQGITAASVYKNFHTMCNGANMAYTKKAFEAVNGFSGIDQIASGDDMLLMYKIKKAFPGQIHYLKSKAAIVESKTVSNWKAFFSQRIRWASKASHYEDKNIFYALLVVYFVNLCSAALALSLVFAPENFVWVLLFFLIKTMVEFWFLQPVLKLYNRSFLTKWFFICIPLHILYTIIAGAFGKFGKYQWKGRETR